MRAALDLALFAALLLGAVAGLMALAVVLATLVWAVATVLALLGL